ncbi:hypothetical protein P7D22_09750 [Lichenihabitans sp. Uapishka_5]|uniref:DUF6880 family protein n=1 Tax=Lichenihabitans sp. Uapishka_5 TaxID=3037302 RepID=UPI0029E8145A|nr:DUF6880 family protein [Lichenihabitans sp. Uapishka_5]MDX7951452.1 hypothetical protein [Lichenihabitans sp. Uapishka_5]
MARKTALTSENLAALGAERLARLILDEAGRNTAFKKLVTAALAGAQGPKAVASIVDKRLAGLARARGFVDWDKRKAFAADLRATLNTIKDELGGADPSAAAGRLIRFLILATGVFERVDDSSGFIQVIFHDGAYAVPELVARMPEDGRVALVESLVAPLCTDDYGLIDAAVHSTIPLLPPAGLAAIDTLLTTAAEEKDGSSNTTQDWSRTSRRDRLVRARQAIADARGDVDAFITLDRERPDGRQDTMAVADRLLAVGRVPEALDWVRRPVRRGLRAMTKADLADATTGTDLQDRERVRLEIRILMALGRKDEAQGLRWRTFEALLDVEILRDYVAHLGDFEEFDALERSFAYVTAHADGYRALAFFLTWPRLEHAATLVVERRDAWAGQHYGLLLPAAQALEDGYPVAATVLYRALLDDILTRARSPAYGHAARYLAKLEELGACDLATAGLTEHEAYRVGLRRSHGRKSGFWSLIEGSRADDIRRSGTVH